MPYTLFSYFRSSASYRVRIALNLKGLSYDIESKHLRRNEHQQADYLQLNPQGLVPMLKHDDRYISQSLSIIEHLDEIEPCPPLLPADAFSRATVRSMALSIACDMHPLCNLRVLEYLRRELGQDDRAVNRWCRHWMAEGFDGLEELTKRHAGERHCFGEAITLADVCLVPQVHNARRFHFDLTPYPTILRIAEHLEQHEAFVAARPDHQPDAERHQ